MDEDFGSLLVPGAIGTAPGGFIEYWNEYFNDSDEGPFADYDGPTELARGLPFLEFIVPEDQAINLESVEVKVSIDGPAEDIDYLRIMLVSPDGTASELNQHNADYLDV
jgi:hypothetical protein